MQYRLKYVLRRLLLIAVVLPTLAACVYMVFSGEKTILQRFGYESDAPNRKMPRHLTYEMPDSLPSLTKDDGFRQAFFYNSMYLLRPSTPDQPTKHISKADLLKTLHTLQDWENLSPKTLEQNFDFYQVKTGLRNNKVRITGYYTPVISVQKQRSKNYTVPFLESPDNPNADVFLKEKTIETGKYQGKDLSLAWTDSERKLKNASLQGSAFVEFPNGRKAYLGYSSEMALPMNDMPKYIFFQKLDTVVLGAGGFPITPFYSVAVDTRYIPLGSCLLAELPILNENGKVIGNTFRILFAQDTGGAIKTAEKMDLYCGIGKQGLEATELHNQYCKIWLLLPK